MTYSGDAARARSAFQNGDYALAAQEYAGIAHRELEDIALGSGSAAWAQTYAQLAQAAATMHLAELNRKPDGSNYDD